MVEGDVERLPDAMTSLVRRRSQHTLSQRHLRAEVMTPVQVLRAETKPRRIPRTAALVQMEVPTVVVQGLLSRRG